MASPPHFETNPTAAKTGPKEPSGPPTPPLCTKTTRNPENKSTQKREQKSTPPLTRRLDPPKTRRLVRRSARGRGPQGRLRLRAAGGAAERLPRTRGGRAGPETRTPRNGTPGKGKGPGGGGGSGNWGGGGEVVYIYIYTCIYIHIYIYICFADVGVSAYVTTCITLRDIYIALLYSYITLYYITCHCMSLQCHLHCITLHYITSHIDD